MTSKSGDVRGTYLDWSPRHGGLIGRGRGRRSGLLDGRRSGLLDCRRLGGGGGLVSVHSWKFLERLGRTLLIQLCFILLLTKLVETCLNLLDLVETCRNLSKLVETCRNLSKLVETCRNLLKLVETCLTTLESKLFNTL